MATKRLSAGAVVVRKDSGGYLYLLLRAYKFWDFPKGIVEAGEDPFLAALREVLEETGIQDLTFPFGERFFETEPYARGKVARYYLAETKEQDLQLPVSLELGRPEHHEYRWLAYSEARELCMPRIQNVLDWAHGFVNDKNS